MMMLKLLILACVLVALSDANPKLHLARLKRTVCTKEDPFECTHWAGLGFCLPSSEYHNFVTSRCPAACVKCQVLPPAPPSNIAVDATQCLAAHNHKRVLHGTAGLSWNAQMAEEAAKYAKKLAEDNKDTTRVSLNHASTSDGENLYYSGTSSGHTARCTDAVSAWYNEIKDYDYNDYTNHPGAMIGHFTQVVWKGSTQVGVGAAKVKVNGMTRTFIVARYRAAGNIRGQRYYDANVLPLA
ncbi:predicted protein [Nematostella vectensis]|uniref:ShKT domain-containing protein n=1 Tax=Nematostella vectensis TaxID=45351 RepID=A7RUQ3_NEMVE|nr:predicted protein [Nematostella vectensis]|eukprot:XP_001636850.1 predicted protein [Nematostella vectensis]